MTCRPPAPLTGLLRQRINRMAHAAGLRAELEARERLTRELLALAEKGARWPDMEAHLAAIEKAGG